MKIVACRDFTLFALDAGGHSTSEKELFEHADEIDRLISEIHDLAGYLRGKFGHVHEFSSRPAFALAPDNSLSALETKPLVEYEKAVHKHKAATEAYGLMFRAVTGRPFEPLWRDWIAREAT